MVSGNKARELRVWTVGILLTALTSMGATYRTENFEVHAPSPQIAEAAAKTAEHHRKALAEAWLGKELPPWKSRCVVQVEIGDMPSAGHTTFLFERGEVFGWEMAVRGPLDAVLDSVLPHEVSHTVFASYFRMPLPRWADEGAATLSEHEAERRRQRLRVEQLLQRQRPIPLRKLLSMTDYPPAHQTMLALYAQSYSLCEFLVESHGRSTYIKFLQDAHKNGWDEALRTTYGFANVEACEKGWNDWVLAGSPLRGEGQSRLLNVQKSAPAETPQGVSTASLGSQTTPQPEDLLNGVPPVESGAAR